LPTFAPDTDLVKAGSGGAVDSKRTAIEQHWRASESGDSEVEHAIYADDAILDHPQSGERFRGRTTIAAQRGGHPADRHFKNPFPSPAKLAR
jgi:hypothetical protein